MSSAEQTAEQWLRDCDERAAAIERSRASLPDRLEVVVDAVVDAVSSGNKVLLCGNGGSAADAQHIAAEFVGRFERERAAWPALALSENVSSLTGIGNDYAYDRIFVRQLEAFGRAGDVLIGLSTSGGSANVVAALEHARANGVRAIAITGADGGACAAASDEWVAMPSSSTAVVQELYLGFLHSMARLVEQRLG